MKHCQLGRPQKDREVAPHAGAWIETAINWES